MAILAYSFSGPTEFYEKGRQLCKCWLIFALYPREKTNRDKIVAISM